MLNKEELKRYNRHIILPEFGIERQIALKNAKVLVVGAGGLGCPILVYLCAAGVGNITIVDPDTVDLSNLQRQILFDHTDLGKNKATVAAEKLKKNNIHINIKSLVMSIDKSNAIELFNDHDVIIDGSDNFATRYLVNDAAVLTNKPLVFGSIFKFEGQVSVFNYQNGPTYRCIYPEPPAANEVPSCSEIGVLGVLPGIIGVFQAIEAIKIITGIGEPLSGRLLIYDALTNNQMIINIERNPEIVITELLENYEAFCGLIKTLPKDDELNPEDAKKLINENEVYIIDVREEWEYEICKIEGSILIPLSKISSKLNNIDKSAVKLIYCHHGIRSRNALEFLKMNGHENLYNLEGGIDNWAAKLDNTINRY
jgi:sulfur-carrier protein adenylyltransferase/sulfurtransferase